MFAGEVRCLPAKLGRLVYRGKLLRFVPEIPHAMQEIAAFGVGEYGGNDVAVAFIGRSERGVPPARHGDEPAVRKMEESLSVCLRVAQVGVVADQQLRLEPSLQNIAGT